MKTYIVTLGCPKNLVDSEATISLLRGSGCTMTDNPADAELLLVGACSFLDASWRETVEELERLARFKKRGGGRKLVLMGCLPKHREEDLEESLPYVDHFLPTGAHGMLPGLVEKWHDSENKVARTIVPGVIDRFAGFSERELLTPGHTAYVKVAEGCNRSCTFCAIPRIRGRQVTRSVADIVVEVERHVSRGVREVTLLAQDIVSYSDNGKKLAHLLDAIAATGVEWIRIFYVHPAGLGAEYIRGLFSRPSVCHYLEMPVQHASSRLLDAMKRSYDRRRLEVLLRGAREAFPDIVIRSEVIVGFPGETDSDFEELKDFVEEFAFDSLGIFPYSPEPGTDAESHPDRVGSGEVSRRVEELASLQEAVSFDARVRFLGTSLRVLVDREVQADEGVFDGCKYAGRFYGQALEVDGEVYLSGSALRVGEFVDATIVETGVFDLKGVVS